MEQDLSLILLLFAGLILLLLIIYSFRTRIKLDDYKSSKPLTLDSFNKTSKEVFTKIPIKTADILGEETQGEPKLNKRIIEDDILTVDPSFKKTARKTPSWTVPEQKAKILPPVIANTPSIKKTFIDQKEISPISENLTTLSVPLSSQTSPITEKPTVALQTSSLLTLYIMPQNDQKFVGYDLLQALIAVNLRFGKMSIFHCYQNTAAEDKILFSAAQVTEPGTFNMETIEECQCSGLVLFMQLTGPEHNGAALDHFIAAAQQLALNLNGILMQSRTQAFSTETKTSFSNSINNHLNKIRLMSADQ